MTLAKLFLITIFEFLILDVTTLLQGTKLALSFLLRHIVLRVSIESLLSIHRRCKNLENLKTVVYLIARIVIVAPLIARIESVVPLIARKKAGKL